MLVYIIVGGVVIIVIVYLITRSGSSAPSGKPSTSKVQITDYDSCEHNVDVNGFITCKGSDCAKGQNCILQRRFVGKDPWKDVDMSAGDNNIKYTQYEFRCVCK